MLFKRFMERLVMYAYWPWGAYAPKNRKAGLSRKKAALVASSAAPGLLGHWVFGTLPQLKQTAQVIGAAPVGKLFTVLISQEQYLNLPESVQRKARALVLKLL